MSDRRRLDAELVRRKIARSREQAVELIRGGQVLVQGMPAIKPATQVSSGVSIQVLGVRLMIGRRGVRISCWGRWRRLSLRV